MKILMIILMTLPVILMANVWTVNWDGGADFSSIQPAIDEAVNNDTIIVYPGEYFENLVISNKSLSLLGNQIESGDIFQAEDVIIHGDQSASAVFVENSDDFVINGFVIMNNYPDNSIIYSEEFNYVRGGGIAFRNNCEDVEIRNCVIKNCLAYVGGGIFAETENIILSNVSVYDNRAIHYAGGVYLQGAWAYSEIAFDCFNRCSIYRNTSSWVQDLSISNYPGNITIHLDRFSVPEINADEYYCRASSDEGSTLDLRISDYEYQPVEHDLWVGVYGSDENSGNSVNDALKTLSWANQLIASDPQGRYTIHVTGGLYSFSENQQKFPFEMKSYVRLEGAGIEQTYIDGEGIGGFLIARDKDDIKMSGFNITNCSDNSDYVICLSPIRDLEITDLWLHNNEARYSNISASGDGDNLLENLLIEESSTNSEYNFALGMGPTGHNTVLNNIIVNDFNLLNNQVYKTGINFSGTDAVMRNSILSNCSARTGTFFTYRNWDPADSTDTLELCNFLMFNNNCAYSWGYDQMLLDNRYTPVKLNNCTIANNINGYSTIIRSYGKMEIKNSIFYNPGNYADIVFTNANSDSSQYLSTINNSLFALDIIATDPDMIIMQDVITGDDPSFIGDQGPGWYETNPGYYQLSEISPCIDAGSPDTLGMNLPAIDLAGNPRIWNDIIDMGCYEYNGLIVGNTPDELPHSSSVTLSSYPNPVQLSKSRSCVFLEFSLPEVPTSEPEINIYNLKGQLVKKLILNTSLTGLARKAGLREGNDNGSQYYSKVWNCRNKHEKQVAAGVYLWSLKVDGECVAASKLMILK
ncbi:MAG: choice-of-anchor Q domain-containing protein [Candidatus Stygibacter australis]|nr:choice-of-anchor Q domain-containing protein [Candidatus Stygibacter australis]MDP8322678.1 choice-of-anchor Q domain-containing protein [Candidatus Stygibacter australis]